MESHDEAGSSSSSAAAVEANDSSGNAQTSVNDLLNKIGTSELNQLAEQYAALLEERRRNRQSSLDSTSTSNNQPAADSVRLPKFYSKPEAEDGSLGQKLREEARSLFLQKKSQELLTNQELKALWVLLEEHHTQPLIDDEKMINYKDFKLVLSKLSPRYKSFFTPLVFAKLQQKDPYGRISITQFFHYVMRKTWLCQSRIGLWLYDMTGQGYLTERDLELYILELIPTLPHLEKLEQTFHSFYVCTAVRKFAFFLDPLRLGKIRIVDILAVGFLDDLLELRDPNKAVSDKNWFGVSSAMRVYAQYLNLDTDRNGMLSKEELLKYGTGTLTEPFVDRLFQECLTYDGEMDYKGYLDFVLAMENKKDPASLQYFFRILDVNAKGYLDAFALNYFFRAIQKLLEEQEQPVISLDDIKDEIFDMVKPVHPAKITFQDLVSSLQGDTVVSVLIDLNGFYTYENREMPLNDPEEEEETEC